TVGPVGPRSTWAERWQALPGVLPFILVVAMILLGILLGIWTPVEAAAVGVVLVLLIGVARRRLGLAQVFHALIDGAVTSASVFMVVIGALIFSRFLAITGFTAAIKEIVSSVHTSPFLMFLIIILIYFILGMFMEAASILALTVPMMMPIIASMGWNPIWFGVVLVKLMEIAAVTPPV